jgi:sulfotransferase 6B1
MSITKSLQNSLTSRNPFVRKVAEAALRVPKFFNSFGVSQNDLLQRPPIWVNSIPKSGTHLLMQIVEGLPHEMNYGEFVATMTSSFRFRERSPASIHRFIRRMLPGEIARGHLFFDEQYLDDLVHRNVVNYFIYRDPRDIVLSGAHYLRTMNAWHRLHRYFRDTTSIDEAITRMITGLQPPVPGIDFPDIGQRYGHYCGWLNRRDCLAIRFEDLQSDARPEIVREMAEFYAAHSTLPLDIDSCVACMLQSIAPAKSHTFRRGEKAGWRKAFSHEHRQLFHEVAGDLLIELGYEHDSSWVNEPEPVAS